jgi:hypothetical protein
MAIMQTSIPQLHNGIMQNAWQGNGNHAHTHNPSTYWPLATYIKKQWQSCQNPYTSYTLASCKIHDKSIATMPIPIAQPHTDILKKQWKSNCSHAQLHTPTTDKSNAIQLIKQLKSCNNNSQNQCKPIDKSMNIMFMHTASISIKQWKTKEQLIHPLHT